MEWPFSSPTRCNPRTPNIGARSVERVCAWVPLLGKAQRKLAIARLSIALEALLNAGVTVIESWEIAAAASGSPAIRRVVAKSKTDLLNGRTPGEMVRNAPRVSHRFRRALPER